jgi:hypothetical protein
MDLVEFARTKLGCRPAPHGGGGKISQGHPPCARRLKEYDGIMGELEVRASRTRATFQCSPTSPEGRIGRASMRWHGPASVARGGFVSGPYHGDDAH